MPCRKKKSLPNNVISLRMQEKRPYIENGEFKLRRRDGNFKESLVTLRARIEYNTKFPVPRPTFLK
ncbi:hypothetical protein BRCON_1117 [Candidatus Sumerlaea chitinivorans]|uniref:Uncharacterized protein n=1 Tax=Sumerlaea chitinivorans TaxID=2250252 RepID=A0A2Z4Y430_SUMC1|nr:hypothetical protein BRCON_1117 [Candidatus Sumerlaea chitinivorans]